MKLNTQEVNKLQGFFQWWKELPTTSPGMTWQPTEHFFVEDLPQLMQIAEYKPWLEEAMKAHPSLLRSLSAAPETKSYDSLLSELASRYREIAVLLDKACAADKLKVKEAVLFTLKDMREWLNSTLSNYELVLEQCDGSHSDEVSDKLKQWYGFWSNSLTSLESTPLDRPLIDSIGADKSAYTREAGPIGICGNVGAAWRAFELADVWRRMLKLLPRSFHAAQESMGRSSWTKAKLLSLTLSPMENEDEFRSRSNEIWRWALQAGHPYEAWLSAYFVKVDELGHPGVNVGSTWQSSWEIWGKWMVNGDLPTGRQAEPIARYLTFLMDTLVLSGLPDRLDQKSDSMSSSIDVTLPLKASSLKACRIRFSTHGDKLVAAVAVTERSFHPVKLNKAAEIVLRAAYKCKYHSKSAAVSV